MRTQPNRRTARCPSDYQSGDEFHPNSPYFIEPPEEDDDTCECGHDGCEACEAQAAAEIAEGLPPEGRETLDWFYFGCPDDGPRGERLRLGLAQCRQLGLIDGDAPGYVDTDLGRAVAIEIQEDADA